MFFYFANDFVTQMINSFSYVFKTSDAVFVTIYCSLRQKIKIAVHISHKLNSNIWMKLVRSVNWHMPTARYIGATLILIALSFCSVASLPLANEDLLWFFILQTVRMAFRYLNLQQLPKYLLSSYIFLLESLLSECTPYVSIMYLTQRIAIPGQKLEQ